MVEWESSFPTTALSPTPLTHTNYPPSGGNDHIACYGGDPQGPQVTRHNSGGPLKGCRNVEGKLLCCETCGPVCIENGGVGIDPPLNGSTDMHMYTGLGDYMNQELICKISGGH